MNMRPRASSLRPRHGMALPMVIVVLLVLSASFAGGVALARGERALDDAGKTGLLAQTYAETGLQRILSDRSSLGLSGVPGASDSTRVTFSGGYYDMTTTRLRTAVGTTVPGLYFLRSHSVISATGIAGGPSSEYTVTQLAVWMSGTMTVQSAFTGINGTTKAGASGNISGVDQCAVASGGTGLTIPAVAVPTTAAGGGSGYQGSLAPLTGNPQVSYTAANPAAAAAASPIQNWQGIYDGTSIPADFTVDNTGAGISPSADFPNVAWFTANPNKYPVIYVKNGPPNTHDFSVPNFGRGLMIVQDDVTLSGGSVGWDGIILVGGRLRSNGSNSVSGATVTGLNTQMGYTPGASDINDLNGTKTFVYDSCKVSSATAAMGKLRVYKNTWSNSYKTF